MGSRPTILYLYKYNMKMVGLSWSFAYNVSADFASKNFRSFCKNPSHSAHSRSNLTKLRLVVLVPQSYIYINIIWRWWDSNPRPKWIKANIYGCSILLSRTNLERYLTNIYPQFIFRINKPSAVNLGLLLLSQSCPCMMAQKRRQGGQLKGSTLR